MTAKDFIKKGLFDQKDTEDLMIEFAKYHVQQALKQASEKSNLLDEEFGIIEVYHVDEQEEIWTGDTPIHITVNKESILNAYPLDNIK